jgi:hypothetical protein
LVTWQRPRPFARDLREPHKKAGFSVVLDNNPSSIFNQLSFCTLHTVYALLFTLLILLFCCQVTFCALVYFMWVFVLSQFPSHSNLYVEKYRPVLTPEYVTENSHTRSRRSSQMRSIDICCHFGFFCHLYLDNIP